MPFPNHPDKYNEPAYLTPAASIEATSETETEADLAVPESVILCYQPDFFEHVVEAYAGEEIEAFAGSTRFHPLSGTDGHIGVLGGFGVGAPATAIRMEQLIAHGTEAFCIVGGCAGLGGNAARYEPVVCDSAVRDEGVSHHYLPSETYVAASATLVTRLKEALDIAEFEYQIGPTWTTDAFFRETVSEIERYRDEGVLTVEMEAAAVFAIAEYRDVDAAALLCPFDLVMADEWKPKQGVTVDGLRDLLLPACNALGFDPNRTSTSR